MVERKIWYVLDGVLLTRDTREKLESVDREVCSDQLLGGYEEGSEVGAGAVSPRTSGSRDDRSEGMDESWMDSQMTARISGGMAERDISGGALVGGC